MIQIERLRLNVFLFFARTDQHKFNEMSLLNYYLFTRNLCFTWTEAMGVFCSSPFPRADYDEVMDGAKCQGWCCCWSVTKWIRTRLYPRILLSHWDVSFWRNRRIFHHCYDLIFRGNRVQFTTKLLSFSIQWIIIINGNNKMRGS